MTKKITTLIVKVQDEAVGPVMRALNGWPGVTNIAMDQGSAKPMRETREPKTVSAPRSSPGVLTDLVIRSLGEGRKSRKALRDIVQKAGLRRDSISSLMDRLTKGGDIQGDSTGYTLTAQGKKRLP